MIVRTKSRDQQVTMKLLLVLFLTLSQGLSDHHEERPSVRIFVVKQQKFKNRGHYPDNNRRVIFKMVNESNKPVVVYGFRDEELFDPAGYIIELKRTTGEWVYPNPDNAPMPWADRSDLDKSKYRLLPGKSITFVAELSMIEVGRHFKRTVYASFKEDEEPVEIRGQEFCLKVRTSKRSL